MRHTLWAFYKETGGGRSIVLVHIHIQNDPVGGVDLKIVLHAVVLDLNLIDQASVVPVQGELGHVLGSGPRDLGQSNLPRLVLGDGPGDGGIGGREGVRVVVNLQDQAGSGVDLIVILLVVAGIELNVIYLQSVLPLQLDRKSVV